VTPGRVVATIEARTQSTRLPEKVLRLILKRPMLELLVERLARATRVDDIVIATTDCPADDRIARLADRIGVGCFRGSEDDVLGRVLAAAQAARADVIVEITGDCPLIDPRVVDEVIAAYGRARADYVSNTLVRTFPRGLDTQVFATAVLERVDQLTDDPVDREHVSLYIYEHPERFRLHNVESGLPARDWDLRLTVDTVEDFELVSRIYEALYPANPEFGLADILRFLDQNPSLRDINRHVQQKPVH
jgi:spore coat polysaccharide biosynthesis protein SpsF